MLEDIQLPDLTGWPSPSSPVRALLEEADARIDHFTRTHHRRIHNFVACDFRSVHAHLQWIIQENLLCGDGFCEWGAGFGVVTLLAAVNGLDASGIEIEPDLIEQAVSLAEDFELDAQFAQGSFIPDEATELIEDYADIAHVDTDSQSGYHELDRDITQFELFFAFPWPGEHPFWETVFDRYASNGAMLLSYHGIEQMRLQRKI